MARSRTKAALTTGGIFVGLLAIWGAIVWRILGVPPAVQLGKLIYKDVPTLEIPIQLAQDNDITFQARILEKRNYWLNLRVYFNEDAERRAGLGLVGGPVSQPKESPDLAGVSEAFRVVVRDADRRVVHERTVQPSGRESIAADSVGRRVDTFILNKGLYEIRVTPLSIPSAFAAFRTSLELTYQPKSTAID